MYYCFIPFYGWVISHCMDTPQCIYSPADGHLGCFCSRLLRIMLVWTHVYNFLYGHKTYVFHFLGIPKSGVAGSYVITICCCCCLFVLAMSCGMQDLSFLTGSNPRSLHWEQRVLTSGLPGKSLLTLCLTFWGTVRLFSPVGKHYFALKLPLI